MKSRKIFVKPWAIPWGHISTVATSGVTEWESNGLSRSATNSGSNSFFLELNLQVKIGQNQSSSVKASQHNAAFEVSRTIIGHVTSWKKKSSIKISSPVSGVDLGKQKKSMGFHGHMERHRAQSRRSISQASKMHCFPWPVSKLKKNIGSAPKRRSEIWTAQGFWIAQNGPGKLEWNWTCTAQVPTLFSQSRLNLHVQLSLLLDTVFISVRCTPLQK